MALLHDKPQIMSVFRCQIIIFAYTFLCSAFRLCPLVFNVTQRIKDSQIKIYGGQSKLCSQAASCHFILHGIAGINLW